VRELNRLTRELQVRLLSLYQAVSESTGPPTGDQQAQMKYFEAMLRVLDARVRNLKSR
jgi:hypothetical protein